MAFTPYSPSIPGTSAPAASSGFTPYDASMPVTPTPVAPAPPAPPSIHELGTGIMTTVGDWFHQMAGQAKAGAQNVGAGLKAAVTPPDVNSQDVRDAATGGGVASGIKEAGAQALKGGAKAVANVGKAVGGVGQILTAPLAPAFNAASKVGEKIGGSVPSDSAMKFEDMLRTHPQIGQNTQDIMNMANLAFPEVMEKGAPVLRSAAETTSSLADKATSAYRTGIANSAVKAKAAQVNNLAEGWLEPTTINKNTYNGARDVLAQSPEAPRFLAELGASPEGHVEGGNYATEATAQSLRNTAGKLSSDTVRPALQAADYSTPKTPVSDIVATTVKDIRSGRGPTVGNVEAQVAKAEAEGQALQRKYPDGMSLTDMHDNKITYAGNGKYSPIGDEGVNNSASINRAFGRAFASAVEKKAPADVPVAELNQYFQKYYKAADYLDALNGKKAPVSFAKTASRFAAKYGAAAVAEHIGGGIISAFAGYSIGKALEHALENMSESSKGAFLENIRITNPPAYKAVTQYLKNVSEGNTGVPLLPAASRIIPKAPSANSQMESRARTILK